MKVSHKVKLVISLIFNYFNMNNPFKFEKKVISVFERTVILGGSDSDNTCICAITTASKPCAPRHSDHLSKCDTCTVSNACNP